VGHNNVDASVDALDEHVDAAGKHVDSADEHIIDKLHNVQAAEPTRASAAATSNTTPKAEKPRI
jgi:hypothetical protein